MEGIAKGSAGCRARPLAKQKPCAAVGMAQGSGEVKRGPDNQLSFPSEAEQFSAGTLVGQIVKEYLILKKFYEFADNAGLKVPESPLLRRTIRHRVGDSAALDHWSIWPSEEIEPICALAQHYGLPTCMIDWTYSFSIALYFAVIGAVEKLQSKICDNDNAFAIYALNTKSLDTLKLRVIVKWPIEIIQPPYFEDPNLSAQKGLLSFWRDNIPQYDRSVVSGDRHINTVITKASDFKEENFTEIPLNKKYAKFIASLKLNKELLQLSYSLLYKINFSYSCLEKAVLYLHTTGTNSRVCFPGYSGIVRYMHDNATMRKQSLNFSA